MKFSHIQLLIKLLILLTAAGLLIFSCNLFNLEEMEETSDVRVSIEKDRNNTALIPDIESMVEAYSVTLSRDGYEDRTIDGDQNQSQYNFSDVPVGEWGVEVLAHDGSVGDENTLVIAEGSGNLDVTTSAQSSIEITVEPQQEATGGLSLEVVWSQDETIELISATLTDTAENVVGPGDISEDLTELENSPGNAGYVYEAENLNSSVYTLNMKFQQPGSSDEASSAAAETRPVHIYDNVVTDKTVSISEDQIARPPTAPADFSAEAALDNGVPEIGLSWNSSSSVEEGFQLERSSDGTEGSFTQIADETSLGAQSTSFTDPGESFSEGQTWYYRLKAVNDYGESEAVDASAYIPILVQSISIDDFTVSPGESTVITATVSPSDADNQDLTWSSADESIATVSDSNGTVTVTGVESGSTTITAEAEDGSGVSGECIVSVNTPVTGVSLNIDSLSLEPDQTEQLTATVSPGNATNQSVSWSSSD